LGFFLPDDCHWHSGLPYLSHQVVASTDTERKSVYQSSFRNVIGQTDEKIVNPSYEQLGEAGDPMSFLPCGSLLRKD
jgi:hypothetical protein